MGVGANRDTFKCRTRAKDAHIPGESGVHQLLDKPADAGQGNANGCQCGYKVASQQAAVGDAKDNSGGVLPSRKQ